MIAKHIRVMMMKINLLKSIMLFGTLFLSFLTLELTFRFGVLEVFFTQSLLRMILFVFVYAVIATALLKFIGRIGLIIFLPVFIGAITIYYFSQTLYHIVVDGFYSVNMVSDAGDGLGFSGDIFGALAIWQVIYFIPFIAVLTLAIKHRALKETAFDVFDSHYNTYRTPLYMAAFTIVLFVGAIESIPDSDESENIAEDALYDDLLSTYLAVDRFGLMTFAHRDIANAFREPVGLTDEDERALDFLENRPNHSQNNRMSNLFEDKNLIYITAESLDTFALHPELMPNYFDMLENSYHFENFYAPLYYRTTADTEFMKLTSYFPNQNVRLSMDQYQDNHFPNTLPRLFQDENYYTHAYHNYSDHYYPRSEFHPETIGFDNYTGAEDMDLWDEDHQGQHPWPSDLEMMENTMDDFINEDQFFTYYLSVTGHLPYSEDHDIAHENLDTIIDIMEENDMDTDIDEQLLYYHAAHWEFDKALGYMIETLKDEGVYDDTVIIVASDHYAYGIDDSTIEDYDTRKNLDESELNMHKVPMMVHNPEIDGENTIDQTISTIDITPTISNMFGLDIHYDQILGYDVFEDYGGVASFQDLSFMKDDYYLEVERNLNVGLRNDDYTEEDVMQDFNYYTNRREISRYILETDFLERHSD